MAIVLGSWTIATALVAQQPAVHYLHHGIMPPGAIGSGQLQRGGPLPGFFQPVEIKAPPGALVSLALAQQFEPSQPAPRKAGMLIGSVYRLRVSNIRLVEGTEVFPTIEVIDRLYTPPDQAQSFAIPVEITEEDLRLALDGKFVTRVIYLEDPRRATPARENLQSQSWFEAAPGQDPLAIADGLGRPVAILRMGARVPDDQDERFFFGSPPFVAIASAPAVEELPLPLPTTKPQRATGSASAATKAAVQAAASATDGTGSASAVAKTAKVTNLPPPPSVVGVSATLPSEGEKR